MGVLALGDNHGSWLKYSGVAFYPLKKDGAPSKYSSWRDNPTVSMHEYKERTGITLKGRDEYQDSDGNPVSFGTAIIEYIKMMTECFEIVNSQA